MFEAGLIALIQSDQATVALIANRIYPLVLPQNAVLPAATYQVASGSSPNRTLENALQRIKRLQLDFWGETYSDVKCVEAAIAKTLDGFSGTLSDGTRILMCLRDVPVDRFETSSRFYRVMNEYEITYVE